MKVVADGVHVRIGDATILERADFEAEAGRITGLIGPNGSGKSTLLRCLYRALKPTSGSVYIGEDDVWRSSARQAGLRTAVVAQDHDLDNDFSVQETVAMGRIPHKRAARTGNHRRPRRSSGTHWPAWAWTGPRTGCSPRCPAASANACWSPGHSPSRHRCCCSTSRPTTWTSARNSNCSTWSEARTHHDRRPARPRPRDRLLRPADPRARRPGDDLRAAGGGAGAREGRRGVRGGERDRASSVDGKAALRHCFPRQPGRCSQRRF